MPFVYQQALLYKPAHGSTNTGVSVLPESPIPAQKSNQIPQSQGESL